MNSISVVIPTYNRGEALGLVLDRLLVSDRKGLGEVEIVVVDDGSSVPAAPVVNARQASPGFMLKCVRQENAGPAAARNLGFTTSHGDIVIFIDDDILAPPELIRQHVEAHELNPSAVIFGMCVPPSDSPAHIGKVLEIIYGTRPNNSRFEQVSIVSSQHLSVEREDFPSSVYASYLRTPAAEEFEFSARLWQRGIAIFNATEIGAVHDQQLTISSLCDQQYKHAMGCAEAVCKLPGTLVMDELAKIATANGPVLPRDPLATKCKQMAKALAAIPPVRRTLVLLCELTGRIVPSYRMNTKLLLFVIGVFFFAGYREGLGRFGPKYTMTEDEKKPDSSGYDCHTEARQDKPSFRGATMRLAARCLNGSIRLAGGLLGSLLGSCVRRKWLYFPFVSEALSCVPFSVGWKLRNAVYKRILSGCGDDTILHFGVTLEDERTKIGRNVWVSVGSYIDYAEIGDSVLIGPHAVLLAGGRAHRFERLDIPIKDQGNLPKKPLLVGMGAWLGAHATVMADVGEHAIVGAGAVVTKEVPAYAVVGGNPARVLYMRDANLAASARRCS